MGNTDSVVVQKRLSRFRVEERPVVEGVFDRLYGTNTAGVPGKAGKVLTLDMLKSCMDNIASDSMMKRVYAGMCSMDIRENPLSHGAGVSPLPHGAGVSREQLVVFLADVLRGTAEERAPLVMAMTTGTGNATCDQIIEFLQDLVSAVVDLIIQKGWLQGWNPNRMGDRSVGVKLLAEQMSSELKPSGKV
ncbi:hypothetical protein DPEC_G00215420 [Dallia pectoralis]|uniref:Uncharacterized protein n=1 Tax=Dallia pectoralis TaxID=75939 RepID=A0ACC2G2J1_DALPE|nr:hypothetical protein DPEC_G00215420 [Dallia pectoralis]